MNAGKFISRYSKCKWYLTVRVWRQRRLQLQKQFRAEIRRCLVLIYVARIFCGLFTVILHPCRNNCYEHCIHIVYNFISHTPGGIFFIDTHCRLGITKGKTHLLAINRLQPSGRQSLGWTSLRHWRSTYGWTIKLHPPPPCTRPGNYNKLIHVASSHLNTSYRHVLTYTATTYIPHSIRNVATDHWAHFRSFF